MDLELADNVAVIVGGARGIGLAIGEAFAREGSRVAILDRDAKAEAAAAQVAAPGGRPALGLVVDATDLPGIEAAAVEVQRRFGRLDHVVYAAATGSGKYGFPYWEVPSADWPRVLEVNLVGAAHVAQVFGPRLAEARRGTMLFIASIAGQIGSPTDPPYSASKAGLINFAQCAARDLAPYGVRVNSISPGMIQTVLNRSVWEAWNARQPAAERQTYEAWAEAKILRGTPLGRWQEPADIAHVAVFLASPRAKNITGQTINVDGGQVMHA
jgi:2-hydroxycyclohexanecarboxyl-CoA dehydrogenase